MTITLCPALYECPSSMYHQHCAVVRQASYLYLGYLPALCRSTCWLKVSHLQSSSTLLIKRVLHFLLVRLRLRSSGGLESECLQIEGEVCAEKQKRDAKRPRGPAFIPKFWEGWNVKCLPNLQLLSIRFSSVSMAI